MEPNLKKVALMVLGIIATIAVISISINWWINVRLPKIITQNNESPYHIQYKKLNISLLARSIEAVGVSIVPKERAKDSLSKHGIFASVKRVKIDNFSIISLLFTDKIEADLLSVYQPKVTLYKSEHKAIQSAKGLGSNVVKPFQQVIKVDDINLEKGSFYIINIVDNQTLFSAENVTIKLDDISISDKTLKQKIPFTYKQYAFSCDGLAYKTDNAYLIKLDKMHTTNSGLEATRFSMVSELNRRAFVKKLAKEEDLYTLKAEKIAIKNMDWGFSDEVLFFKTSHILIDEANANIYRSKMPNDDMSIKPLYNKLLRELSVDLKVDTISVVNSKLVYEEEKNFEKGSGVLQFDAFNLRAYDVRSGFEKKKLPDVVIAIDCKFMNTAPMKIDWRFNVMEQADSFKISGRITNFETSKLAVFTKPYLNATTKGTLDEVYFNFAGTNEKAMGDIALKYHGFKIKLYQKKSPEKESKIKSWVGKLLVSSDSEGKLISTDVAVERIKEKSFFNYFWRCVAEGMKKLLM
jgi:hypothetical protein